MDEEVAVGAEDLLAVRTLVDSRVSSVRGHPADAREAGLRPDPFKLQLQDKFRFISGVILLKVTFTKNG